MSQQTDHCGRPISSTESEDARQQNIANENTYKFLYGQPDPPANIKPEGKLTTLDELMAMLKADGWTITSDPPYEIDVTDGFEEEVF